MYTWNPVFSGLLQLTNQLQAKPLPMGNVAVVPWPKLGKHLLFSWPKMWYELHDAVAITVLGNCCKRHTMWWWTSGFGKRWCVVQQNLHSDYALCTCLCDDQRQQISNDILLYSMPKCWLKSSVRSLLLLDTLRTFTSDQERYVCIVKDWEGVQYCSMCEVSIS